MKSMIARVVATVLIGIPLVFAGCGDKGPKLYKIKGTVTHGGKPIGMLQIGFVPDDQNTKAEAMGITDANGKFELMIGSIPGVFPGPHTVTAQDPLEAVGGSTSKEPDYMAVAKKYGPGVSTLKMTIEKNESNLELKLD